MATRRRPPSLRRAVRIFVVGVSLFGGLLMLAGGVYAAQQFSGAGAGKAPLAIQPHEGKADQALVVAIEPGTDWSQLTIEASRAARIVVGGHTLAVGPVALPMPPGQVVPGMTLQACSLAGAGELDVVLRSAGSGTVAGRETLHVQACGPW